MDKLIKKFELMWDLHSPEVQWKLCAEECKKITVKFTKFIGSFTELEFEDDKCIIYIESEGEYFPITYTIEELFNKFIEEYYENSN